MTNLLLLSKHRALLCLGQLLLIMSLSCVANAETSLNSLRYNAGNHKQYSSIKPQPFTKTNKQLMLEANELLPAEIYPSRKSDSKVVKPNRQQKKSISLREAILVALRYNPDVTNAEIDRIAQKYDLRLAQWQFEWQYELSGDAAYRNISNKNSPSYQGFSYNLTPKVTKKFKTGTEFTIEMDNSIANSDYDPTATATLSQPLLKGASRQIVTKELSDATDRERINRLQLKKDIITIVRTVSNDYRAFIAANNSLNVAKRSYREAQKTFEDNATQIRLGKIPRTDNITQKAQVESLRLQVVQAENNKSRSRQQLLQDMGLEPDIAIEVPSDVNVTTLKVPDLEKTIDYALNTNIEFLISKINLDINKRAYEKAYDDTRWQLDLHASATVGNSDQEPTIAGIESLLKGRNHSETVGVKLNIPIHNLELKSALMRAKIQIQKDKANLDKAQRELKMRVKNLVTDLQSQIIQIKISVESVKLQKQNYLLQKKKQQLGKGTSIDVTNSQNQLIAARNELISNKIAYLNTLSELRDTLGITLNYMNIKVRY